MAHFDLDPSCLTRRGARALFCAIVLSACGATGSSEGHDAPGEAPEPGVIVAPGTMPQALQASFDALRDAADTAGTLDAAGALAAYPTSFRTDLGYDPTKSLGLDTIQASALAITDGELAKLGQQGFVVSTRREFPTFQRGLAEIYSEHLPLYVSADAILESVHSSYDTILLQVEQQVLLPQLKVLLRGMHEGLAGAKDSAATKRDVDLYLAVARGMLESSVPAMVAGGDAAAASRIVAAANAAEGI